MKTREWIKSNRILLSYHGDGSGYSGRGYEKAYGYGEGVATDTDDCSSSGGRGYGKGHSPGKGFYNHGAGYDRG